MKRIILVTMFCISVTPVFAEVNVPNLEATMLYDFQDNTLVPGFTSKMVSMGDFDFRVGYTVGNKGICSISYNLKNLEKLGPRVKYLWETMQTSFGGWAGYNFKENIWGYGLSLVVVEVNFK